MTWPANSQLCYLHECSASGRALHLGCCTGNTHVPPAICTHCAAWEGEWRLLVAPLCPQKLCTDPTLPCMACKLPASHPTNSPACMQHPVQCSMHPAVHACMPLTCAQLCQLHDADCVAWEGGGGWKGAASDNPCPHRSCAANPTLKPDAL